jgi:hypothetical protein
MASVRALVSRGVEHSKEEEEVEEGTGKRAAAPWVAAGLTTVPPTTRPRVEEPGRKGLEEAALHRRRKRKCRRRAEAKEEDVVQEGAGDHGGSHRGRKSASGRQ